MTFEEAIRHCEEVAEEKEQEAQRWINDGWQSCFKTLTPEREAQYLSERKRLYYQCLECASERRQLAEWLKELKRDREILEGLSMYFQSLVVDAVINQRPLMFDMRDATKEERESVKQYIADSAKTTGVNFWSIIGEVNADE